MTQNNEEETIGDKLRKLKNLTSPNKSSNEMVKTLFEKASKTKSLDKQITYYELIIEFEPEKRLEKQKMLLESFYCELCSIKHASGTPRMKCEVCSRYICVEAFVEMTKVGKATCPMCDGKLISLG